MTIRQARQVGRSSVPGAGRRSRISPAGCAIRGRRWSRSRTATPTLWPRRPPRSASPAPSPTTANCSSDPDIDVVDVVTGNRPHFQISRDALSAGKHVLCEKPVHADYRKTRAAADAGGAERGLRTKLGFTFRYAPAIEYAKHADRLRLRRRAVHLQRLRAEQPVDRPGDAAAPVSTPMRTLARSRCPRSRATARRSSTSCTGGSARR